MTWYKCLIRGENFPGQLIGETRLIGFYVTRFVQEGSPHAAEHRALTELKSHASLQLPDGAEKPKDARVFFEEIVEVAQEDVPDVQPGLSFYAMEG